MSRRSWIVLIAAVVLALIGFVGWWGLREASEQARADRDAASRERAEREARRDGAARSESADLMPDVLRGLALGMTLDEVRASRSAGGASPSAIGASRGPGFGEPGLSALEEQLPNGARVVYGFRDERLERLQVLSLLPSAEAIGPHLAAMNARYGTPTGAWDCPQTGGVPTRRFTWRHARTTVSDVFLIYGGRVSVTLYIAPSSVIAQSLARSSCRPISADELEVFPVATPEQMRGPGSE
ncbi:MAG: hypothetical protein IT378_04535 [Sandaracinaceae bacterium]|nr:hypothetical protein [Sandaracinaceae bacterium]